MTTKQKYQISAIFDKTGNFTLNESLTNDEQSRVDGENIIGSVEGVFFVPDGFSRNNRFYPCELWKNQLVNEEINRRLGSSIMFGCIGHSAGPVTEQDLAEGKVSHFMDKLWIDENTGMGMGKAYLLNTEAGRNLRTYLKAGSKLKVSSRGEGSFAEGVEKDGHPMIDPSSYNLITFDFVIEPGFTETNPQLMEGYIEEKLIENTPQVNEQDLSTNKEADMEEEKILNECRSERDKAVEELKALKESFEKKEKALNNRVKALKESQARHSKLSESKVARLKAQIKKLQATNEAYAKLGTVEDLRKLNVISKKALAELSSYKKLGTQNEISESLDLLLSSKKQIAEYRKLGGLADLKKLINASERFSVVQAKNQLLAEAKELSEKSGKPIEEVSKMIESLGIEEAKKSLAESVEVEKAPAEEINETVEVEKAPAKEEKKQTISESIFADYNSKYFLSEEDDEEESDEEKKPVEPEENDEEEKSDEEVKEPEENEDEEEKSDEERIDDLEDDFDSLQSQVDAISTALDKISGEEAEDEVEEEDFDFEVI